MVERNQKLTTPQVETDPDEKSRYLMHKYGSWIHYNNLIASDEYDMSMDKRAGSITNVVCQGAEFFDTPDLFSWDVVDATTRVWTLDLS